MIGRISAVIGGAMLLSACQSYGPPPHPLDDTSWRLADVETSGTSTQLTQELSSRHRLTFRDGGRLVLQLDCNRGNADWSASMPQVGNGSISIGPVASTKALCPRPTYGEELAAELPTANGFTLTPDGSSLIIRASEAVYVFARD
ncbi:META domain-containing protein [Erythrobacter sp. F6033]|uniref:META domain-containing protein n=1 Tax=Erythrobacter sp. F6033 TaxID=2926401 RepID=UPI001FF5D7E9|nr:META domain-containing protein [Erythrobacter sp. F6033]MCK0129107.1 META domain-containing protein [Erythrobacter sp. F6033]